MIVSYINELQIHKINDTGTRSIWRNYVEKHFDLLDRFAPIFLFAVESLGIFLLVFFLGKNYEYNISIFDVVILPISLSFSVKTVSLFIGILLGSFIGLSVNLLFTSPLAPINLRILIATVSNILVWVAFTAYLGKSLSGGGVFFIFAFILAVLLNIVRLPIYIFEVMTSLTIRSNLTGRNPASIRKFLQSLPVFWDELTIFPIPMLDRHLFLIAKENRKLGLEVILRVAKLQSQRWAALRATLQLLGDDLLSSISLNDIVKTTELLKWLPEGTRADYEDLVLGLHEICTDAQAALESETIYNKRERVRGALDLIERMSIDVYFAKNLTLRKQFDLGIKNWENILISELKLLTDQEIIPNVYIAGSPLATASKVFKGRSDLFRILENELTSAADQRPALLLYGARRTGKTSVIKQLPIRLGSEVIPVEIDLQAIATTENISGLLIRISELISKNCENKRVKILPLSFDELEQDPYLSFQRWLEKVESVLEKHWLLLAIDEYEMFGDLLKQNRIDERIFYLLRSICQHHSKIILLFSGAHTLEDLPPFWSNYFVNVKILKVQALTENDGRELIVKPIPEFNLEYEPNSVERILSATACQPYLLQLVCRDLVNLLNETRRLRATINDADKALMSALISGMAYFNDLYSGSDSDDIQRTILDYIAKEGLVEYRDLQKTLLLPEPVLEKSLRRLVHRDVLKIENNMYQFQTELVRQWVLKKILL